MADWAEAVATAARDAPSSLGGGFELAPHQKIEPTGFGTHVLLAGRGAGKTFAAMHWLNERCKNEPKLRARIIAPTLGDGVASCVEGVDGLLPLSGYTATFSPSAPGGSVVTYPNGSKVWIVGTPTPKDVDRLRALTNMTIDVFEEAAANPQLTEALAQAALSRRSGDIRLVVTTTPRPLPVIKAWLKDPKVTVVRATMSDNPSLPEAYRAYADSLEGTRMYRQEVLGEVVDDVEGALWTFDNLKRSRIDEEDAPTSYDKIAIGVDPAVGSGTTGIMVAGIADGITYVLEDASLTDVPGSVWAAAVGRMVEKWEASEVVVEDNQGGRLVEEALRTAEVAARIKRITSRVSKEARATPVAMLWELKEQKARLVGSHPQFETQCLEWVPGTFSPDRIDAFVHVTAHLRGRAHGLMEIQSGARKKVVDLAGFRKQRLGA